MGSFYLRVERCGEMYTRRFLLFRETADVIDLASLDARAPGRRTFYGVDRSQNRGRVDYCVNSSLRRIFSFNFT